MEHPTQPNTRNPPVDRRFWMNSLCTRGGHDLLTATTASTSSSAAPGQDRGDSAVIAAASHHVPRKQGTSHRGPQAAGRGSRDGRRATSLTSGGCDLLDQRWLRPPRPAVVATS